MSGIDDGLRQAIAGARHVFALTGAGISAESGVPTFRDAQTGLWERYDALDLATPEAFLRDPALVWRWYRWRRELVARARPNAAHDALVRLARRVPALTLVTQNVDGLHQRAGSPRVIEFHGNLFVDRCFVEGVKAEADPEAETPRCAGCGSHLRPGVVRFGEAIPAAALEAAFEAAAACDLFLSIGTSSVVYPAAGLAEVAARGGATVVEINPEPTQLARSCDFTIARPAGIAVPKLVDSFPD